MNISPSLLVAAVGCTQERADQFAGPLTEVCAAYDINTPARVSAFLAQLAHESNALKSLVESLNYSSARLVPTFGAHRITQEQADRYGRSKAHPADQEAIANIVYGGAWGAKNLGNTQPGDGWLFRGRGPIQLTGRANYARFRDRLRARLGAQVPDFEAIPEKISEPYWGAYSAGDYWDVRGLNKLADAGNFEGIVRKVNGGLIGIEDRKKRFEIARAAVARFGLGATIQTEVATESEVATTPVRYMPAGEGSPQEPEMASTTETVINVAKGALTALNPLAGLLVSAFEPYAREKIERELGRHIDKPEIAAQMSDALITGAKQITGIDDPLQATAAAIREADAVAHVQAEALANLEKMLPLMERLNAMEQANIASARQFHASEPLLIDTRWVKLKFLHVLSLGFLGFSGSFVTNHWGSLTAELKGAVITLMIIAGWNGVKDFWMGSSSDSQRKTEMLKQ